MPELLRFTLDIAGILAIVAGSAYLLVLFNRRWPRWRDRIAAKLAGYDAQRALDSAMHSVWLHGNWRWLTTQMTTEEKEAAADAVDRHRAATYPPDDRDPPVERWWRDA